MANVNRSEATKTASIHRSQAGSFFARLQRSCCNRVGTSLAQRDGLFGATETWKGFGWPYFLFAALPFFLLRRAVRPARNWLLGLAAMFVSVGPVMAALLNPSAANVQLAAPWFGAIQVVLAVWVGVGLMMFGNLVVKSWMRLCADSRSAS